MRHPLPLFGAALLVTQFVIAATAQGAGDSDYPVRSIRNTADPVARFSKCASPGSRLTAVTR